MGTLWEQHNIHRVLQRVLHSKNMTEMDTMTSLLLTGQVTSQDLPFVPSRLVRVFLCSTGVDTCTERTAFIEQVCPKMREYCRRYYDLEFQMVDLAWGLTAEQLCSDPDFTVLNLEQIDNCRNTSCGPCFLAFIGQNYGPRPLPASILAKHYNAVKSAVVNDRGRDTRNADIIDQFYIIDTNSVPPVYLLKPDDAFPELNHEDKHVRRLAKERWEEIQPVLRYLLQKGALLAFQGKGDTTAMEVFFISHLEKEVRRGLEQCEDPASRCVLILRDIVDLKNYVDDPKAPDFIQITFIPPEEVAESDRCRHDSLESNLNQFSTEVSQGSADFRNRFLPDTSTTSCLQNSVDSLQLSAEAEICPKCLRRVVKPGPEQEKTQAGSRLQCQQLVDIGAEDQLRLLRSQVGAVVPEANTLRHEVLWKYEEVISPQLHHDYLKKLCTGTLEALQRLTENCSKTVEDLPHLPREAEECLLHWTHCRALTADLCPCHAPLRQHLRHYVTGAVGHPVVLYGECGCGKTKMASALAMELSELIPGRRVCTIRYAGLTADSARVFPLLRSLCCQICTVLGLDPLTVPGDWQHLRGFFPRFVAALPAEVTVVVVVVGLEKLLQDPDAQLTHWLPSQLPQNVKFILTFTVDHPGTQTPVQSAEDLFKGYHSGLLAMKPLTIRDAEVLLNHFLSAVHRRIGQEQMTVFKERFQDCSLPLYVKLLALQARTLHSFSDASRLSLPLDMEEAVHAFFDRLEVNHNREVVSRVLSYMAASQSGVSDAEMEDLLSLDDIVLRFVSNHDHNRRRVPCAVWVKIRRDLEPFLLAQQVDGLTVTVWEHESFRQAVRWRYFHHRDNITSAHSLMADYFLGTWAGREKAVNPVEMTDTCTPPCGVKTDRLVPAQPHMFFCDPDAEQQTDSPQLQPLSNNPSRQLVSISQARLNKRLYSQLPRHLQLSGRETELNQLVLFNYSWIFNRIKGYSLSCCLDDFLLSPGPETNLVRTALLEASPILEEDLQNLAAELSGRLLPYCCSYPWIRTLVRSCDLQGLQHCVLLPSLPYHQIPGAPLQHTLDCGFVPYDMTLVHNDFYLLCKHLRRSEVLVWDMRSGELKDSIFTSQGALYVTPNAKYFVIMDRETEKSFKIHEAGSGEFVGQIIPENDVGKDIRNDQHVMGPLCLSDNRLYVVVVTVAGTILCVYQVPSGRSLHQVPLPGLVTACRLTVNLQHVLCCADDALLVCATDGMREENSVALPAKPHLLAVTGDEHVAVLAFLPDQCMIMHVNYGQEVHTFPVPTQDTLHGEVIRAVRVAPDDQHVLVRADNHVVVYIILPDQKVPVAVKSWVSQKPSEARLVANHVRPFEIPSEYRLPCSHYRDLVFTAAEFSADSRCVLTAIFRHVYVWRIDDHSPLTTLQTPMGITSSLLVSKTTNQLLTHNQGSNHVIVWSYMTSTKDSTRLQQDKLSRPVQRVLVTSDQRLAFAQCRHSDEIGVFDMGTGLLRDLLTHTSEVKDMAITPTGDIVLVITETQLSGTACRLWYLPRRKVIKEWADSASYSISMHVATSLIVFTQPRCPSLLSPHTITLLRFKYGLQHFTEKHCPDACKYIVGARPVVTRDDRFLAVPSALGWDSSQGREVSPCLMVFDCDTHLRSKCFDDSKVGLEDRLDRIFQVEACPLDKSSVALIISVKGIVTDGADSEPEKSGDESSLRLVLLMLDLKQSTRTVLIFLNMPPPDSFLPHRLLFSQDFSLCLDQASTIHDITNCASHEDYLPHPGTPPQCLALNGAVVVYFSDCWLYVLRLFDARVTARCHLHDVICHVTLCSDQRTLLVGCRDGKLTAYIIVDPMLDSDPLAVVSSIPSRRMADRGVEGKQEGQVRRWDKVDLALAPAYSRPLSVRSAGEDKEQKALRGVKTLTRPRYQESILRPIPCKCVRKNEQGRWEKVKEVKVGFKR